MQVNIAGGFMLLQDPLICVKSVLGKIAPGIVTLLIIWLDSSLTAQHKVRPVGWVTFSFEMKILFSFLPVIFGQILILWCVYRNSSFSSPEPKAGFEHVV